MNNSAIRTLDILECLAEANKAMGITEISKKLDIPKSSVFDIVYILLKKGFAELENEELKTFKLGLRAFQIGSAYINKTGLYQVAHPLLEKLKNELGETVYLATQNLGRIVYLDKVEGNAPIRSICDVGSTNLMHLTGLGKAMLAGYSEEKVKEITGGGALEVRTVNTISDYQTLVKSLKAIRETGYAYDNGEDTEMVCCIAAPVYDRTGEVAAAISVSMLYTKMAEADKDKISQKVVATALEISRKLGFMGDRLYG